MVDVTVAGSTYVVEYLPSLGSGLGLSRLDTATFGWEGVEEVCSTEAELHTRIAEMLRGPAA